MASPSPLPTTVATVAPLPSQLTREVNQTGYLESYAVGVSLLVLAVSVLLAWVAAGLLRRRRGVRLVQRLPRAAVHAMNGVAVFVLSLAGVLVLINNYVGYVPSLSALFQPPGSTANARVLHGAANADRSRIVRLSIPAPADGVVSGTTFVYLPPGYDQPAQSGTRYPVVYLLHGYPGRAQDWFTAGRVKSTMDLLIRDHYVGPMIVVSPTASTGYFHDDECLNAPGHFALENYLAFTVVSAIDHTFRTATDRSHRAIGGMSSGGFCALNIGLHHLHRFSVVLASEPYGDPGLHPLSRVLNHNWALWRANSPSFYIPLMRFSPPVASFLDSGGFDTATETQALRIARELAARGQQASYRPAPKMHHTWREARSALPYSLIFAWQHFGVMPGGGSDRLDARQFDEILRYALTLAPPTASTRVATSASPPPSPPPSPSPSPTRRAG
jgi:enterochelin esterase-like enzyme